MQASTDTRTANTAEGLWARHAPDLLRLATVLVGPNEAEDVVAGLSVRQRAAVYFRYWHDMSERQIAESMGVSVGTVRRHLVRAQSILRKELANEGT